MNEGNFRKACGLFIVPYFSWFLEIPSFQENGGISNENS